MVADNASQKKTINRKQLGHNNMPIERAESDSEDPEGNV
jgi:hypothetical protein